MTADLNNVAENQRIADSLVLRHVTTGDNPGWWIESVGGLCEPMGAYRTRSEAHDDLRGVRKFYRTCHLPREAIPVG